MVVGQGGPVFASRVVLAVVLCADPHVESVLPDDVVAQVPLAHVAAQVVLRNHLGEDGNIGRQGELVHCGAGGVGVQTGHDGGAGRGAYGLCDVGVLEDMAGVGERVEVRCLRPVASVTPHRVPALLVAHDEDKVSSGHRGVSPGSDRR